MNEAFEVSSITRIELGTSEIPIQIANQLNNWILGLWLTECVHDHIWCAQRVLKGMKVLSDVAENGREAIDKLEVRAHFKIKG